MTDVTEPRTGRGRMLPTVGTLAAALFALAAFAPFASASPDPVASGTTTLTLNKGFTNTLKKNKAKLVKVSPATLKGRAARFPVLASGSQMDPTSGQGTLNNSGGLKLIAGKKSVVLKNLVLNTASKSLSGKLGSKSLAVASLAAPSVTREGFGSNVKVAKLKLTSKAAKELNKSLGFSAKKTKFAFKANQVLAASASATQPSEVAVIPTGNASLALSPQALKQLSKVGPELGGEHPFAVNLSPISPTTITSPGPPAPTVSFPIGGGAIGPTAGAGTLQTLGGLKLVQNLELSEPGSVTTLSMRNIWVDLVTKTASVEIVIENPKNAKANLGSLGRTSIADINLTGATFTSNPTALTVSVQNATATLQAVTAETLNAVFINELEKKFGPQERFASGDPLGTFSFTAQTQ
jgi:hypothetical protein